MEQEGRLKWKKQRRGESHDQKFKLLLPEVYSNGNKKNTIVAKERHRVKGVRCCFVFVFIFEDRRDLSTFQS